jgi:ribosome-binding ATPase YchF (GTP1/OBG family)
VTCCASLESELSSLPDAGDRAEFRASFGLPEVAPGAPDTVDRLVSATSSLLGLGAYYTTGPEETRAWPLRLGQSTAREAARHIHTEIADGLICAEVTAFADLEACGFDAAEARRQGKVRTEGPDTYIVQDRDVILFKHRTK